MFQVPRPQCPSQLIPTGYLLTACSLFTRRELHKVRAILFPLSQHWHCALPALSTNEDLLIKRNEFLKSLEMSSILQFGSCLFKSLPIFFCALEFFSQIASSRKSSRMCPGPFLLSQVTLPALLLSPGTGTHGFPAPTGDAAPRDGESNVCFPDAGGQRRPWQRSLQAFCGLWPIWLLSGQIVLRKQGDT